MKKILTIVFFLLQMCMAIHAQDIHFSQFNYTPLLINPALTGGFIGEQRVIMNYKDQWASITSPYKTFIFSGDICYKRNTLTEKYKGFGLLLFSDVAGVTSYGTTQANFYYSDQIMLGLENRLIYGLQAGIGQRHIDPTAMKWDNQYSSSTGFDPNAPSNEQPNYRSFFYGDYSAGILYRFLANRDRLRLYDVTLMNIGVALYHLNTPNIRFYDNMKDVVQPKFVFHGNGSVLVRKTTKMAIQPSFMYTKQGPAQELLFGSGFRFLKEGRLRSSNKITDIGLTAAGHIRWGDAFIVTSVIDFNHFTIGISYDFNLSGLVVASATRGGPEFSITYIKVGVLDKRKQRYRPSFE